MDRPTDQTRNLKKVDTIVRRESRVNCDKQTNQQTDMTSQGRVLVHMKKDSLISCIVSRFCHIEGDIEGPLRLRVFFHIHA